MDAVKPETRLRRLEEAITKLAAGQPLGMKQGGKDGHTH